MSIQMQLGRQGRVSMRYSAELPLSQQDAWLDLRRFERCSSVDLLHRRPTLPSPPAVGLRFTMPHRFLGFRFDREARLLKWETGRGWAFSDISKRGPRAAFPHVFATELRELSPDRCRLELRITGLWTGPHRPRWLVKLWLYVNLLAMGEALARELTAPSLPERAGTPIPSPAPSCRR